MKYKLLATNPYGNLCVRGFNGAEKTRTGRRRRRWIIMRFQRKGSLLLVALFLQFVSLARAAALIEIAISKFMLADRLANEL